MRDSIKRVAFLTNRASLAREVNFYLKNASKISLYYPNFKKSSLISLQVKDYAKNHFMQNNNNLAFEDWLLYRFFALLENKDIAIEIYDYTSINYENLNNTTQCYYLDSSGKLHKNPTPTSIKIHNKISNSSQILHKFAKMLNDNKNLSNSIDSFLSQPDSLDKLTSCIRQYLQQPIMEEISQFTEIHLFDRELKASLNQIFDELIEDIKSIYNEGNAQIFKEIVNFFLNIVNIFEIKKVFSKSNILLSAVDTAFEGSRTISNVLEWANSKYLSAISNAIIKLLVQDIAPIILLFENRILHHTLIIDDKIIIDFSGFRCDIDESKSYIRQDLATLIAFKDENLTDIQTINLHYENAGICGKKDIINYLSTQMQIHNNLLSYIECPYFNSSKFVEMIKQRESPHTNDNSSHQNYNYLIICNAPNKYNAKLNQMLLHNLGNDIYYGDKSDKSIKSDILFQIPQDYNKNIDYSQYKINIKDDKSYVVSLSPFVFIPQKQYSDFKATKEELDELLSAINDDDFTNMSAFMDFIDNPNNKDKINSFNFIEQFFKQAYNKQEILQQEEQYFKEGIECLQRYIYGIIKQAKNTQNTQVKRHYSSLEVLLLALTYCVIKNFYTSIKTNERKWWHFSLKYESIKISNEQIDIFPHNCFLVFDDKNLPLCFSKTKKLELLKRYKEVFCIEEFVESLERQNDIDNMDLEKTLSEFFIEEDFREAFKENIKDSSLDIMAGHLQEIDKALQVESSTAQLKADNALKILIDDFISTFFPFATLLFNTSNFAISKKLIKSLLNFHIKDFKDFLFEEIGLVYMAYIASYSDSSVYTKQKLHKIQQAKAKQLKRKAFTQAIIIIKKQSNVKILALKMKGDSKIQKTPLKQGHYKMLSLKHFAKESSKNFLATLSNHLLLDAFNQMFVTQYEKSKKEFERLQFLKFSYKYNPPYALKRKEGVYYPMLANNTFMSFNFINMIIGGKLCTGGLGDLQALFYHIKDTQSSIARIYLLNKLISYLCLDELRSMNDSLKPLDDIEFFNSRAYTNDLPTRPRFLKLKHDEKDFKAPANASKALKDNMAKFNQKMQSINQDERRKKIYDEYRDKKSDESENQLNAIDAYHTVMNYLDDVYMECFNTNIADNTPNPNKHREFLKALNIIGENNIKALYVGIGEEQKENIQRKTKKSNQDSQKTINENNEEIEERPKLIGRLAITIIMQDGLWIG